MSKDKPDKVPWDAVKKDYEGRLHERNTVLCAHYAITPNMLYARVKRGKWQRRIVRGAIRAETAPLARLKQLAKRRIERLEGSAGADAEGNDDAAIASMSALVRLLERITALEQKEKAVERARKPLRVVNDDRRRELARRIEAIQRQLDLERDRQAPQG